MKKKSLLILCLIIIFLVIPYLFRNQIYISIANEHINNFSSDWDTVFVKFPEFEIDLDESDLTINTNNNYIVIIFRDSLHHNNNYSNATIIMDVSIYSWLAKVDIENFAWEGTRWYEEYYFFGIVKWFLVSKTLTGMA